MAAQQTAGEGRVVLVTGGARGIGLACARHLAAAGAKVAVTYNTSEPPGDLFSVPCDVTSSDSVDAAFGAVEAALGNVQVLVSNAGTVRDGLLLRMSEPAFADVVDANLAGAFRVAKRAAGPMLRARWGRMVFVSSVVAMIGSAGQANYAASKAGLIGMARSLARELGSRNITANVVTPGFITTDMTDSLPEERKKAIAASVPLGRFGSPDDVASVIAFLASDAASYVTGAVVPIDGGMGMGH
jgi:3-oxoacyl-[acyl-carrier protein] reductase